jgi:hypothetical protein
MLFQRLADLVLLLHLAFVAFVLLGGLLVLRWPKVAWAHLPAVAWGVFIEYADILCPLTPLEVVLRQHGGQPGYGGSFIAHYLTPVLYPEGLTRTAQLGLGTLALLLNGAIYFWARARRRRTTSSGGTA